MAREFESRLEHNVYDDFTYKIFLLEKEVGYRITNEFPLAVLYNRFEQLDRYWKEQSKAYEDAKKKSSSKRR